MSVVRVAVGLVKMAGAVALGGWAACLISAQMDEAVRRRRQERVLYWAAHDPKEAPRDLRDVEAELRTEERRDPIVPAD